MSSVVHDPRYYALNVHPYGTMTAWPSYIPSHGIESRNHANYSNNCYGDMQIHKKPLEY